MSNVLIPHSFEAQGFAVAIATMRLIGLALISRLMESASSRRRSPPLLALPPNDMRKGGVTPRTHTVVLVVEDEALVRYAIAQELRAAGYEVIESSTLKTR
jgi:hypothetical protein